MHQWRSSRQQDKHPESVAGDGYPYRMHAMKLVCSSSDESEAACALHHQEQRLREEPQARPEEKAHAKNTRRVVNAKQEERHSTARKETASAGAEAAETLDPDALRARPHKQRTDDDSCSKGARRAAPTPPFGKLERTRWLQKLRQQRYRARKKRSLAASQQQSQRLRTENLELEDAIRTMLEL